MPETTETPAAEAETTTVVQPSTKRVVAATAATIVVTTVLGLAANLVIQKIGTKVHKSVMPTPVNEDPSE